MEKEQIVKALECCKGESIPCSECIYVDFGQCQTHMADDALSLIRVQEKRIEDIQAATVRDMHDLIKERCIKGGIYPAFVAAVVEMTTRELLEGGTEDEPAQP